MANYINREVLCEAYTHLDIQTYSKQEDREKLEAELKDFIQPRAKFMFGDDVEVNIEFNEGSLITTIQIVGFVAQLISGYKDFTTGIDELTKDAVSFAQSTNSEVVFKTKTQNCNRVRLEKRTGVLGRINK